MSAPWKDIVLNFIMSACAWASLGISIGANTNQFWVQYPFNNVITRDSLWYRCFIIVGTACDNYPNPPSWLLAVRAFNIMSIIFIFSGCLVMLYSQCTNHQPTRRACSVLFFLAGIFGIIGMAVYTGQARSDLSALPHYFGSGFINGWVGCLVVMCAGAAAHYIYVRMKDNECFD